MKKTWNNLFKDYLNAWKRGTLSPLFHFHLRFGLNTPLPKLLGPRNEIESPVELHKRLQEKCPLSFSALMPVFKPDPKFLKTAIESVLAQTAPDFELLIGLDGHQSEEVIKVVESFGERVKAFHFEWGGISETTNKLSKKACGTHLLLVDHDDWIAPDLLYCYHRELMEGEDRFLYCDEFKIDVKDRVLWHSYFKKPEVPPFPYVFFNVVTHALMVPKKFWLDLRSEVDGAQDFDLVLRLDQKGVKGKNVGFPLYGWRVHGGSTAGSSSQKRDVGLKAVKDYREDWEYEGGKVPFSYRGKPKAIECDVCVFGKELGKDAFEEMARFAMQKDVGFVTGVEVEKFFFPVQRVVEKVGSGCLMVRRELLTKEDVEYLNSPRFDAQPIANRLSKLGYKHIYTPYA